MHLSKRAFKACAITNVWPYPATDDNAGPVEYAFACRCGKVGTRFKSDEEARAAAARHFDAGQPNG